MNEFEPKHPPDHPCCFWCAWWKVHRKSSFRASWAAEEDWLLHGDCWAQPMVVMRIGTNTRCRHFSPGEFYHSRYVQWCNAVNEIQNAREPWNADNPNLACLPFIVQEGERGPR